MFKEFKEPENFFQAFFMGLRGVKPVNKIFCKKFPQKSLQGMFFLV